MTLYSVSAAAQRAGMSRWRFSRAARRHGAGQPVDGHWLVFTEDDIRRVLRLERERIEAQLERVRREIPEL